MEEEKFTDGFKSRIVEFARAQYDKGQNNFEMFCGIPIGSINGPKKNGMAAINLAKIAERCPELSLRWLLPVRRKPPIPAHPTAKRKVSDSERRT